MRYEGPIYRPPSEATSLLIHATVGCPHNKCTFCMIYKKGPRYRIKPVKEICEDIDAARDIYAEKVKSIFFPAGNSIAMPARDLAGVQGTFMIICKSIICEKTNLTWQDGSAFEKQYGRMTQDGDDNI